MIISVDFDGCVVENHYPAIGPEMPGAISTINQLYLRGHCIIINSCRARDDEEEMKIWLKRHGVMYCHVNENCRERIVKYRTDCRKISADIYIDDKNIGGFAGWKEFNLGIATRECGRDVK